MGDQVDQEILSLFEEAFAWMENARNANGMIYVHCTAGISRSSSFVLYYMMRHLDLPLSTVLPLLKSIKPNVAPNPGFLRQLCEADRALHGASSLDWQHYLVDETFQEFPVPGGKRAIRRVLEDNNWDLDLAVHRLVEMM
eukprot:TRINITY_DN5261_c0_g2_i5.p2 TRINITY_DN5261_c0_g2~~TRINITY_DN5261_c0_g2_i5.p2  ORF type:complete len:150 (+),score=45.17 TRINITY_DN5261_c0_g2_i5:32-451(+)